MVGHIFTLFFFCDTKSFNSQNFFSVILVPWFPPFLMADAVYSIIPAASARNMDWNSITPQLDPAVQCTVYGAQLTVNNVQYTVHSLQCNVCTVQCATASSVPRCSAWPISAVQWHREISPSQQVTEIIYALLVQKILPVQLKTPSLCIYISIQQ